MRHGVFGKKLNRRTNERNALFRNLVTSLILHERIETTEARAKAVRGLVDRVIRDAKHPNMALHRRAAAWIPKDHAVRKLFAVLVPRYESRASGFTRMYRLGPRRGDAAPIVLMEMVDKDIYPPEVTKTPRQTRQSRLTVTPRRRAKQSQSSRKAEPTEVIHEATRE